MKYQSELIKEMVDSRGHEKSSLHYQSECVETWIEENKGAYPKLCDYESEWINYIVQNPIGEFPYETVTTNTTATVNNVVPYAYKSAILTGQTLVNIFSSSDVAESQSATSINSGFVFKANAGECKFGIISSLFKPNTTYLIMFESDSDTNLQFGYDLFSQKSWDYKKITVGINAFIMTSTNEKLYKSDLLFRCASLTTGVKVTNIRIIEYQEGMENWDIPYFEGMQSVKMPFLKVTGKNLFNVELEQGTLNSNNGAQITTNSAIRTKDFIELSPNKTFTLSKTLGTKTPTILIYTNEKNFVRSTWNQTFTLNENEQYIKITDGENKLENLYQIEEGSVATSYEPHQSNILTTSEEVELRAIGGIQDELDLVTGELTQRIGEVVFDGSESWAKWGTSSFLYRGSIRVNATNNKILNDKLPVANYNDIYECTTYGIGSQHGHIGVRINDVASVEDLIMFLSQNPITVQYPLTSESIKTVDLSVTDQDGNTLSTIKPIEGTMNIEVSGSPISPIAVLEVPVEAVTQNLASFIEEE